MRRSVLVRRELGPSQASSTSWLLLKDRRPVAVPPLRGAFGDEPCEFARQWMHAWVRRAGLTARGGLRPRMGQQTALGTGDTTPASTTPCHLLASSRLKGLRQEYYKNVTKVVHTKLQTLHAAPSAPVVSASAPAGGASTGTSGTTSGTTSMVLTGAAEATK